MGLHAIGQSSSAEAEQSAGGVKPVGLTFAPAVPMANPEPRVLSAQHARGSREGDFSKVKGKWRREGRRPPSSSSRESNSARSSRSQDSYSSRSGRASSSGRSSYSGKGKRESHPPRREASKGKERKPQPHDNRSREEARRKESSQSFKEHRSDDRSPRSPRKEDRSWMSDRNCYSCGKEGHLSRECPREHRRPLDRDEKQRGDNRSKELPNGNGNGQ